MQREQEQRDREDQEWDELVALTWEQTYKANDFATRINMAATAGTEDLGAVIAEARGWLTEPEVASNGYLDRGWLDMALWMHGGLNAIT